jgi:predicted membrane protein
MEDFELNIDKDFSTDEPLRSCGVKLGDLSLEEIELKLGAGSGSFDFSNTRVEELEIEFGVGELEITMGSSSPRIIELDAGIGDVFLDLTGDWKNDLKAYIQGGIGSLKVLLPRTCNLQIEAGGLMGDIDAREFNKNGKNYHRASDENNDITLYIDIVGAIGEIELELE